MNDVQCCRAVCTLAHACVACRFVWSARVQYRSRVIQFKIAIGGFTKNEDNFSEFVQIPRPDLRNTLEFVSLGSHSSKRCPAQEGKVKVGTFANLPPFSVQ